MRASPGYALQLIAALRYLAGLAVVHRDIKPQNIFLKGGSCVLGDFGLVKRQAPTGEADETDREFLRESSGPGMPRSYRTPDLVEYLKGGSPPTWRSDVFQLGLVLAELFTGKNPQYPIRGDDFTQPVELDAISEVAGLLGKPIRNLLTSMLAVDPSARPETERLLDDWQGLYLDAAEYHYKLEGKAQ